MSDSAGLATGGVSSILYMAPGGDPTACELRNADANFFFSLDPRDGVVPTCSNRASCFFPTQLPGRGSCSD
jgi:hypothetical protein